MVGGIEQTAQQAATEDRRRRLAAQRVDAECEAGERAAASRAGGSSGSASKGGAEAGSSLQRVGKQPNVAPVAERGVPRGGRGGAGFSAGERVRDLEQREIREYCPQRDADPVIVPTFVCGDGSAGVDGIRLEKGTSYPPTARVGRKIRSPDSIPG